MRIRWSPGPVVNEVVLRPSCERGGPQAQLCLRWSSGLVVAKHLGDLAGSPFPEVLETPTEFAAAKCDDCVGPC